MYCWNCGKEVTAYSAICPNCGAVLVPEAFSVKEEKNGMAIWAIISALLFPRMGWIFGAVALSRAFKRRGAGLVLSVFSIVISISIIVVAVALEVLLPA